MLLLVGLIIVIASCLGGFMMSGGALMSLVHPGEIAIIVGIGLGLLVISSPKSVLLGIVADIATAFKGAGGRKQRFSPCSRQNQDSTRPRKENPSPILL